MGGVLIHLGESNLLNQFTTKICSDLFLILTPKHTEVFLIMNKVLFSLFTSVNVILFEYADKYAFKRFLNVSCCSPFPPKTYFHYILLYAIYYTFVLPLYKYDMFH